MAAYGLSVELGGDGGENQKAKSRYSDFPMVASLFCALLLVALQVPKRYEDIVCLP